MLHSPYTFFQTKAYCIPFFLLRTHTAAHLFATVLASRPGMLRDVETLGLQDRCCTLHYTIDGPCPQDTTPQHHSHVLTATGVWYEEGPEHPQHHPCLPAAPGVLA